MARVLIAETDRNIRQFFAGILSDCGHTVETCADAVEASTSLASGAVDVVVTDLVLELGTEPNLARDCAALGIVTLTLSGHKFSPCEPASEPPKALLEKPFRFDDLQTVLDAVAQKSEAF